VERAMERGTFSLDAMFARAADWCLAQLPGFSAKYPPGHARETVWKSLPGAGLRAGEGG
jgi:hypothetical protein